MLRKLTLALMAGAMLFTAPAPHAAAAEQFHVELCPSAVGSTWYVGLGAFAKQISEKFPEIKTTLFPGTGLSNLARVGNHQSQLAICQMSAMKAANDGAAPFGKKMNLRGIANIHDLTSMTIMVPPESPVKSLYDIAKNKMPLRVNYGSRGGGTADLFMNWLLEEYGVSKKDLRKWGGKVIMATSTESTSMLQDGLIDLEYMIVSGGGEGMKYLEVLKNKDMRFLDVEPEMIKTMIEKHGLIETVIPANYYYGKVGHDVHTLGDYLGLAVDADLPDEIAYKLTKTFIESRDDIIMAVPGWKCYTRENACKDMPIPLHPGAERYYREIGVLK